MRLGKFVLIFLILNFSILFVATLVRPSFIFTFAQGSNESPEEIAAKYGITFPIAELGNCENYSACRSYCEDPINYSACIDFAKSKGFYRQDPVQTNKEEILAVAKNELGCDSYDSCMAFCQDSSNFDKCDAFAKGHNLGGGHVTSPEEQGILEQAKQVLGCDSPSSCMGLCSKQENYEKCSSFAQQTGLRGGEMQVGPGGCTSEETCQAFCSNPENYEVCASYSGSAGHSFSGPGGCTSQDSCREYCSKNPKECGFEGTGESYSYPVYNPQEMCSKTPDCSWNNNRCECVFKGSDYKGEDPQDYCKKYPEKCAYDTSKAAEQCAKYAGCKWENNTCQCSQEGNVQTQSAPTGYKDYTNQQYTYPTHAYDPASECVKYPGCSWTGSTCHCSGTQSGGSQNYQSPPSSGYDPATECAKTSGCSWTGSTCQCSSQSSDTQQSTSETQTPPTNETQNYTPPSGSGSYTYPSPGVQGVTTGRSLLVALLSFLRDLFAR